MKKISLLIIGFALACVNINCRSAHPAPQLTSADITKAVDQMTLVMVHDVTNPPLAARFFSYACISGYEVLSQHDGSLQKLSRVINQYPDIKKATVKSGYNIRLSALLAIVETAAKVQPSGALLKSFETNLIDSCLKAGFTKSQVDSSLKYAQQVSKQVLAYAKSDGYNKISNYKRYELKQTPGSWSPTPPAYMTPVEPYFATVRPFTLTSCGQFVPAPPVAFSTDKRSVFYKYMQQCHQYDADSLTAAQKTIAGFWDCNPFAVQDNGHMLIGLKKISPGAHWMGITGIACSQAGLSFEKSLVVHSVVAIGLMDSFISCWNEKYKTNRIRPETAIHQYLDPKWRSFLQTPPFPEYLSGHSVISSTAAVILTSYFGNHFSYTDNIEVAFGISPRKFSSFESAAEEAGFSRLLGGIHFEDGITNGKLQGDQVGNWVLARFGRGK
ncbi:vanadium-dependent haloperoxidase [Mucilaginibacter dorajii]|uniref:Phosphatidic acid phosphatase type 2/haloperoxidase domain-containing protein n=1 Tax=Mucilaginibacter dorajii TaxID=692994 RepID=A0ABP7PMU3_9SPHI|nr:vanadium-dependent haloperoxidase [Mucilaginibacter dorajii]MCS3736317.1 hypothetical protein [Mucilaginibacter dorajii]